MPAGERSMLAVLPTLAPKIKKKLITPDAHFTVAEVASMVLAAAESFLTAEPMQQAAILLVAKGLLECLQENIVKADEPAKRKKPKAADLLYQFRITLLDIRPPIWRRIQDEDCTLDKLHEHVQTAMGWTNSHLHHFKINETFFGDPMLLAENFEDLGYEDSTRTQLSAILPTSGKRFWFQYEYDFGDSWWHEILFEGSLHADEGKTYPLCLDGARACPPEDVGGTPGYEEFLEAMADPGHERHDELVEWVGKRFDPESFNPAAATKRMKRGLPNWRRMM